MWLLLLEAFMAMMVLVFIVWWTMFSGRDADLPAQAEQRRIDAPADPAADQSGKPNRDEPHRP